MASPTFVTATLNAGAAFPLNINVGSPADGDVLYAVLHTGGAGSDPISPPAGWTTLDTGTHADGSRYGLFRKVCSSTSGNQQFVSAGASGVGLCYQYTGNTASPEDVTVTKATGSGSVPTIPNITPATADTTHLFFVSSRDFYTQGGETPVGYTQRASDTDTQRGADKAIAGTTPITGLTTTTAAQSNWVSYSILIASQASGPTVSSVNNATPVEGASITFTVTGAGASQGASTITMGGSVVTPTAWADTAISIPATLGINKFGEVVPVILTVGGVPSATYNGVTSILPTAGTSYVNVGTPNADPSIRLTASADAVSGDQAQYDNPPATVNSDLTWNSPSRFRARLWTSGSGYGNWAWQEIGSRRNLKSLIGGMLRSFRRL